jgi:hypothetical protein
MTRTRLVVVAIVALFVVGGVGLYIARDQVLGGDSVPALTLPSAAPSAAASSGASAAASADPAATASSATASASGWRSSTPTATRWGAARPA